MINVVTFLYNCINGNEANPCGRQKQVLICFFVRVPVKTHPLSYETLNMYENAVSKVSSVFFSESFKMFRGHPEASEVFKNIYF